MKSGGQVKGPTVRKVAQKIGVVQTMARSLIRKIIKAVAQYKLKIETRFLHVAHNPSKYPSAFVSTADPNGIKTVTIDINKMPPKSKPKYVKIAKSLKQKYGFPFDKGKLVYFVKGNRMAPQKRLLGGPGFKAIAGPARFQAAHKKVPSGVRDAFKKNFPTLQAKTMFSMRAALRLAQNKPAQLVVLMRAAGYRMMTKTEYVKLKKVAQQSNLNIKSLQKKVKQAKAKLDAEKTDIFSRPQFVAAKQRDLNKAQTKLKAAQGDIALFNYARAHGGLWIKG